MTTREALAELRAARMVLTDAEEERRADAVAEIQAHIDAVAGELVDVAPSKRHHIPLSRSKKLTRRGWIIDRDQIRLWLRQRGDLRWRSWRHITWRSLTPLVPMQFEQLEPVDGPIEIRHNFYARTAGVVVVARYPRSVMYTDDI